MNPVHFGSMHEVKDYCAIRTNKNTYVKTPQGATMLFDEEEYLVKKAKTIAGKEFTLLNQFPVQSLLNK